MFTGNYMLQHPLDRVLQSQLPISFESLSHQNFTNKYIVSSESSALLNLLDKLWVSHRIPMRIGSVTEPPFPLFVED